MELIPAGLFYFSIVYALLLIFLTTGLAASRSSGSNNVNHRISVVVPARNEAKNIEANLKALLNQTYPVDDYEVIVVDDRSLDETADRVRALSTHHANLRLVVISELPDGIAPKKNAINEGIQQASGEVIFTTDADCRPYSGWLKALNTHFDAETGMVVGFSPIVPRRQWSVFENFTALDALSLASVAAGGAYLGYALTATGRSLAYRKSVFEEIGGFEKIARMVSGDDDLFLHLVKKTKWRVRYCVNPDALVPTAPPETFRQFLNQRIRQGSKSRKYPWWLILFLVSIYVFNLGILFAVPASILTGEQLYLGAFGIKAGADFLILLVGATRFRFFRPLIFFPVSVFLHPLYVVVFGLWGQFGKFEWKDERFDSALTPERGKKKSVYD